ncbi:MAG: 50S ribosomal protein L25 [Gaiellaceae bacterium]
MAERVRLEVRERQECGSAATRRLRSQGLVPGVLYGRGIKSHAIAIPERELRRALSGEHGAHAVLDVLIEGQTRPHASVLKEYQRDPVRGNVIHFDIQVVRLDEPIQATVGITVVGEAPGTKIGGALSLVTHELRVQALPGDVPQHIDADVSSLELGSSLRVADLVVGAGVTILDDLELVVATVTTPSQMVEEVEEGEAAEGEEAAEGAAAEPSAEGGEGESSE